MLTEIGIYMCGLENDMYKYQEKLTQISAHRKWKCMYINVKWNWHKYLWLETGMSIKIDIYKCVDSVQKNKRHK